MVKTHILPKSEPVKKESDLEDMNQLALLEKKINKTNFQLRDAKKESIILKDQYNKLVQTSHFKEKSAELKKNEQEVKQLKFELQV